MYSDTIYGRNIVRNGFFWLKNEWYRSDRVHHNDTKCDVTSLEMILTLILLKPALVKQLMTN